MKKRGGIMLRIDPNIKYDQLPLYVVQHLSFHPPELIKSFVAGFTFLLLDLSLLFLLYPFIKIFYILSIPLYIFIHIWAVRLFVKNPYTTQFESILFLGSLGTVMAIIYTLTAFKLSIYDLGITSKVYYVFLSFAFLAIFFVIVRHQIKKYSNLSEKIKEEYKAGYLEKFGPAISVVPALGYIFAQNTKDNEIIMYSVLLLIAIGLASFGAYMGAKQFHKYFFMKANMRFVHLQKPDKKTQQKLERKGIVYK